MPQWHSGSALEHVQGIHQCRNGLPQPPPFTDFREIEAFPEPQSWQLEDFQDIVPHRLSGFQSEDESAPAYGY
nr:hypothetical protein [Gammaproteobacteria bacterium]